MSAKSTSFRLSEEARQRLTERAEREGLSATALLERLIIEGIGTLDHPGVIFRGPPHDRRAGLAAGPDVWEIIARLRELEGSEEQRIAVLAEETELHSREIRRAVEYAAAHSEEIQARIERNEAAGERSRQAARHRRQLLG